VTGSGSKIGLSKLNVFNGLPLGLLRREVPEGWLLEQHDEIVRN
jgi:hypothetical protein